MLKGEISVESQFGIGSAFIVSFPLDGTSENKDESENQEESELIKESSKETNKESQVLPDVLMVEDDYSNAGVIEYLLQGICKLETAISGEEAIEKTGKKQYAAILMDIALGRGISGLEATKRIRKIKGYQNTPIVAVTALAMKGQRELFLSEGCSHYISKPFDKKTFLNLVNSILYGEDSKSK